MNRRILVTCCVSFVVLTMSGCIGLIVNSPKECKDETPSTKIHDIFVTTPPIKEERTPMGIRLSSEDKFKRSTKAEFLEEWGKPDEIISKSERVETWIYYRRLWCGVMPVLILPIPFILPVCDGFDRIEFKGNEATRLHTRRIVKEGGMILVIFAPFAGASATDGSFSDPACRFPLYPNNGVDSDVAKPATQVTP